MIGNYFASILYLTYIIRYQAEVEEWIFRWMIKKFLCCVYYYPWFEVSVYKLLYWRSSGPLFFIFKGIRIKKKKEKEKKEVKKNEKNYYYYLIIKLWYSWKWIVYSTIKTLTLSCLLKVPKIYLLGWVEVYHN